MSTSPIFGRAYSLQINTPTGDTITLSSDTWEPEALRITAEVEMKVSGMWESLISVWNADALINTMIPIGSEITLRAGYRNGNFGTIFNGQVVRTMMEKQNSVDFVTTFQAIVGYDKLTNNFVNYSYGAGQTQQDIIQAMAQNARNPFTIDGTELLKQGRLPKGGALVGCPKDFLARVARDNNLYFTMTSKNNVVSFMQLTNTNPTTPLVYSAPIPAGSTASPDSNTSYTIVGTPSQLPNGVALRVLLDSRLEILAPAAQQIKIDNTVIRQIPASFGGTAISYPVLTRDGVYAVAGIRHLLDSRGQNWYSEIFAVLTGSQQMNLMGINTGDQNPNKGDINSKLAGTGKAN